ncbi:hypothetical protein GW17_00005888 [Ensete ventricosum]|nr:hypothetical protein GW17_00005888 [Ensete ventricosum]
MALSTSPRTRNLNLWLSLEDREGFSVTPPALDSTTQPLFTTEPPDGTPFAGSSDARKYSVWYIDHGGTESGDA